MPSRRRPTGLGGIVGSGRSFATVSDFHHAGVQVHVLGFHATLTGVGTGLSTITRAEWVAYKLLLSHAPAGRALCFGDYAIAYPIYAPAPFLGSASIRYTITDDWLIVRGRSLKGPVHGGFGQFQQLCGQLVANPAYSGPTFSWGDEYIDQCGRGQVGTGNLTTWRSVGTNHHITFVARHSPVTTCLQPDSHRRP